MGQPKNKWQWKGLSVAAWDTRNGGTSFTIQKRFKPKDAQEWQSTNTLFEEDLRELKRLIGEALEWIDTKGGETRELVAPAAPGAKQINAFDDSDVPF